MYHSVKKYAGLRVAIIMDGNGRWAMARGKRRLDGHASGAKRVIEIVEGAEDLGISDLTLFAFSTENWQRTKGEVDGLMALFRKYINTQTEKLIQKNVRVRFIGSRSRLGDRLLHLMDALEEKTAANTGLNLVIALNYGGRDEITRATQNLAHQVAEGRLAPQDITESMISNTLDTKGLKEPDLLIRTSGEFRISNFLPWQAIYSEFAFAPVPWPDFTLMHLKDIVDDYYLRDRRYGATAAE